MFPRFPLRNLCSLVMHAVFSLVYAATDTAYCWALISLGLAESRILLAAPADTCPRTSLISFCTVQLRTLCAARSLATLSLGDLWSSPWGVARLLGIHGLRPCPHPLTGVGQQQQQHPANKTSNIGAPLFVYEGLYSILSSGYISKTQKYFKTNVYQ